MGTPSSAPHSPNPVEIKHGSEPRVGIIGGGQLARMLCLAAAPLGIRTVTVERQAACPAASVSSRHHVGDWNEPDVLRRVADDVDVLTLENEFVDARTLEVLETEGVPVLPSSHCLRTIQDKLVQKRSLQAAKLPVPEFFDTPALEAIHETATVLGYPFLLKSRRNGYDGKGNYTVRSEADIEPAWNQLNSGPNSLFAEAFFPFKAEIAVMVCRSTQQVTCHYPVVETVQKDHICHVVKAPAAIDPSVAEQAIAIAEASVNAVSGIGSLGVELFLSQSNEIVVNELAPRVHNSGHYTIEASHCSQFENHLRAILGWPLGAADLVKPHAVMINLLGQQTGNGFPRGVEAALRPAGVHLHLYGKAESRPGRKMGHLTTLGDNAESTLSLAQEAAQNIMFEPNDADA